MKLEYSKTSCIFRKKQNLENVLKKVYFYMFYFKH